jgi:hypothetical protein
MWLDGVILTRLMPLRLPELRLHSVQNFSIVGPLSSSGIVMVVDLHLLPKKLSLCQRVNSLYAHKMMKTWSESTASHVRYDQDWVRLFGHRTWFYALFGKTKSPTSQNSMPTLHKCESHRQRTITSCCESDRTTCTNLAYKTHCDARTVSDRWTCELKNLAIKSNKEDHKTKF